MKVPDWDGSVDHNQCFHQWLSTPSPFELQLQPHPRPFLSDHPPRHLSASATTIQLQMSNSLSQLCVLQGTSTESMSVGARRIPDREEKVQCSFCPRKVQAKNMDRHVESFHQKVIICPWEKCNAVSKVPSNFRKHYAKQ